MLFTKVIDRFDYTVSFSPCKIILCKFWDGHFILSA